MKLIDRFAHLAQGVMELLLFLSLDRDLDQWDNAERQNRQHADRDHQLDERETGRGRGDTETRGHGEITFSVSPYQRVTGSVLHCFTINLIGSIWSTTLRPSLATRCTFARSKASPLSPVPIASTSKVSKAPSPLTAEPAAGASETSIKPCSSIDCVIAGAALALAKMLPAETDLILITLGSKRMVSTANPSGASDLNCTVNCCFSPTRSSPFSETRRNSVTLASASLLLTSASLFGESCSTTSAAVASGFALADEAETPVPGETI